VKDSLLLVTSPLRYLNGEVNAVHKDFDKASVRVALAFPDLYELGMSHLGLKILYEIVNAREEYLAERVFAPWPDREALLRQESAPLTSLESGRPLLDFDMVGFTLPYEMTCTNILNMLDLAGLPVRAEERDGRHPLVGGGGPGAFNPEPLADFFDFFLLGDGEEAILEIAGLLEKRRGDDREETLRLLAAIQGVYVPRLYRPFTGPDGRFAGIEPTVAGQPTHIRKRILLDLDAAPYPVRPAVPFLETTHDRITIEIARGCIQRCRFCQAGTTYRPYRERSPATALDMAKKGLDATGYDEISLAALSCGDYRHLEILLAGLMNRHGGDRVSISLPSLRPGTLTEGVLREIKKVKRTGFTIAPEAASQRLRDVVSKGITEEQIMETCSLLFSEGWSRIKLYFMIGLPTETAEDREGIVHLCARIRTLGKKILRRAPHLSASVSSFVPKPHTPFQWATQLTPAELHPILGSLRQSLKRRGITFKWHQPELSALEGAIARGDRGLGRVIQTAWRKGRTFDGWTEKFVFEPWVDSFREHGYDFEAYVGREHSPEESLPWDHLAPPDLKTFLLEEHRRSLEAAASPACDPTDCPACGICEDYPVSDDEEPIIEPAAAPTEAAAVPGKIRLEFAKYGPMKYLPHLSLIRTFHRAFRRAHIPVAHSLGHSPHPKMQAGPPLPIGFESDGEYLDVELATLITPAEVMRMLAEELPAGLQLKGAISVPLKGRSLFDMIGLQTYRVVIPKEGLRSESPGAWIIARILEAGELILVRTRKGKTKNIDLRPSVSAVEQIGESEKDIEILLTLLRSGGGAARPDDVIRIAGGFEAGEEFSWHITRTANKVLQEGQWHTPIALPREPVKRKIPICRR
jgi:radical SAM family uncharacterized protein/radical SAM-linked protein